MTAPHTTNTSAEVESLWKHFPDLDRKAPRVREVLEQRGTPIFLADRATLERSFRELESSLGARWPRHLITYSFKTNYQVARSGHPRELGAWAEVVSGREYGMAREWGYRGDRTVFNGPYKTDAELARALEDGALINVNDHTELDRLCALSATRPSPAGIGLRLSFELPRLGHSRFGFSLESDEATRAVAKVAAAPGLELAALHTHAYGDTDDATIYAAMARRVGEFAQGHARGLKYVNLGGGFPGHSPRPRSRESWDPRPIDAYVAAIAAALRPFFPDEATAPALIVEPGRYLVSDPVVLVTEVVHVHERQGTRVVNTNGSISMVPLTHYRDQMLRAYTPAFAPRVASDAPTIIHGATCRENDVLLKGPFPRVEVGDFLVTYAAGAYNSTLSPDFIFASPDMEWI
jgi:diaminopimelate decarboxylase